MKIGVITTKDVKGLIENYNSMGLYDARVLINVGLVLQHSPEYSHELGEELEVAMEDYCEEIVHKINRACIGAGCATFSMDRLFDTMYCFVGELYTKPVMKIIRRNSTVSIYVQDRNVIFNDDIILCATAIDFGTVNYNPANLFYYRHDDSIHPIVSSLLRVICTDVENQSSKLDIRDMDGNEIYSMEDFMKIIGTCMGSPGYNK